MSRPDYILFDRDSTAIVYGNQQKAVQRMLDFDFLCRRERPSVSCVVNPTGPRKSYMKLFFGQREVLVEVFRDLSEAARAFPSSDVLINFASFRSAFETSKAALSESYIRTVVVIAEGIPERDTRKMISLARGMGKWIIGPATVGGFVPGSFKIGNAGGAVSNLLESQLYKSGSVGFVSKSGGMLNEMANVVFQNADGLYEGIAIGGDAYPGSTLLDHVRRYERNPDIKMIVVLGEVGGRDEYGIVEAMKAGEITKPLIAWVTGTCSKIFPTEVQFGHAGAMAREEEQTADAKNAALAAAGASVPKSFDDFGDLIASVYSDLKAQGKVEEPTVDEPPQMPVDYNAKKMRRSTSIISTIADDRCEELLYAGLPISKVIEEGYGVGDVISLLWFKKKLPSFVSEFFELALKITADHGPCVSGAHNAIVTARAGKDLTAAVASGLLTIGPRFGGAIDAAAYRFLGAKRKGTAPFDFVKEMKERGINIPGIGHRVKSVKNPDKRVELLKAWARENLSACPLLDYALEVEKITTSKRGNLILNVDGCLGILFVDVISETGAFSPEELDEIIDIGSLNALFVVGRTIGMVGHYLDQKRLRAGLYRHSWDDVLYMLPEEGDLASSRKV